MGAEDPDMAGYSCILLLLLAHQAVDDTLNATTEQHAYVGVY
jgi:hypothetical protein